ncbi:MAG: DNA mismatch endonuclease Vsr [Saprospiraceae bacterium]|nr:DNA mismatch endonuclease Vsr [Saprospiraceae bacterium]
MSRIKGKNTGPEIIVRKFLFSSGFRFRLYDAKLPGKPDIVLAKYKTVIFVHGCFWHGHSGCKYFVMPKTRTAFWSEKFLANKNRDKANVRALKKIGWRVIIIWECQLNKNRYWRSLQRVVQKISLTNT